MREGWGVGARLLRQATALPNIVYGPGSRRAAIMRGHDALPPPIRQATLPSLGFGHPNHNLNSLWSLWKGVPLTTVILTITFVCICFSWAIQVRVSRKEALLWKHSKNWKRGFTFLFIEESLWLSRLLFPIVRIFTRGSHGSKVHRVTLILPGEQSEQLSLDCRQ